MLTKRGVTWTDAKLLVITSPVVVLLAVFGVESLWRAGRRIEGGAVGVALAVGILASNAFTYHDTNLLPNQRYEELMSIGDRFGSDQAALLPEFDEIALYALQDLPPDGPGFSYKNPQLGLLADGTPAGYGMSYDLDQIPPTGGGELRDDRGPPAAEREPPTLVLRARLQRALLRRLAQPPGPRDPRARARRRRPAGGRARELRRRSPRGLRGRPGQHRCPTSRARGFPW